MKRIPVIQEEKQKDADNISYSAKYSTRIYLEEFEIIFQNLKKKLLNHKQYFSLQTSPNPQMVQSIDSEQEWL
jgi:hypothetical protein